MRRDDDEAEPIRVVTTEGIAGNRIIATLGFVFGLSIRSRGLGGNIMAGLDVLGNGGALSEYRDDLTTVRREAMMRMEMEAKALGAHAVIGVRFDTAEVGHDMTEIVAYGTAVLIEHDE
jgi:uncharacterized protein YbjQ (UPF0145 family)